MGTIVSVEYKNIKNIKDIIRIKEGLPKEGLVKVTTTRNSPPEFDYKAVSPSDEAKRLVNSLEQLSKLV